jgi:hypothetical protein
MNMSQLIFSLSVLLGMQYSSQYQVFYVSRNDAGVYYYPEKLSPVAGANASLFFEKVSNSKNHFGLGFNFNQKGFIEKGQSITAINAVQQVYSKTYRFNYLALQFNFRRDLMNLGKSTVFLNNGVAGEYQLNNLALNKFAAVSYAGGLGAEFEMNGKWNLLVVSEFRTAFYDYNDFYTGHYKPYSLGLSVGLKMK